MPENGCTGNVPVDLPALCVVSTFPTTLWNVSVQLSGLLATPLQPVGEDTDVYSNYQAFHRPREVASFVDNCFEGSGNWEQPVSIGLACFG